MTTYDNFLTTFDNFLTTFDNLTAYDSLWQLPGLSSLQELSQPPGGGGHPHSPPYWQAQFPVQSQGPKKGKMNLASELVTKILWATTATL